MQLGALQRTAAWNVLTGKRLELGNGQTETVANASGISSYRDFVICVNFMI